ncbi:MAG: PepSY domain-containing protein [Clostridiales bacterium]|nr:PepSY domain-containing protein [Clostridiales bacterium]
MKKLLAACFGTTKKAILSSACIAAAAAAIGGGAAYAANTSNSSAPVSVIGEDLAQHYAFADADIDPAAAENLTTTYDEEDGQFVYEVEFTADDTEYEYWVKASDGTIIRKSVDIVTLDGNNADSETAAEITGEAETVSTADTTATAEISIEDAKEIALADANVAADDATFVKAKQDKEDGVSVYDIEFYTTSAEYEYEIRVSDGTILDKSVEKHETASNSAGSSSDSSNSSSSGSSSSSGISVDKAKQIALNKAGLSASEVTFTKAMKEKDDGITVYEIEFYKGATEYECTINASTGAILEYDVDVDD